MPPPPRPPRPRFQVEGWSFTWDPDKATDNLRKHGVRFVEGALSFLDPHGLDGVDEVDPSREKLIAYDEQHLLLTVYIEVEGEVIRIISARRATRAERQQYERSARAGGRALEAGLDDDDTGNYRWRRNPYAAKLRVSGIRVLASALPPGSRSFESWKARHSRRQPAPPEPVRRVR